MLKKPAQNAFTIIELLVVIVIITIISLAIAPYLNVSEYIKQSRDSRRISSLLTLQTAINASIATGNIALLDTRDCSDCDSISGTLDVDGNGWVKFVNTSGEGLSNYIAVLPIDPANKGTNAYFFYSNNTSFELNTALESQKYMENTQSDGGNDPNLYERGSNLTLH